MDRDKNGQFQEGHKNFNKVKYENCKVDGCSFPHKCRGYCSLHYQRWYKYGNANEPYKWLGRPKSGKKYYCEYCAKEFYRPPSAIKRGRIRFCSKKCAGLKMRGELKILKPIEKSNWYLSRKGYLMTTRRRKIILQHRWIVETKILKRQLKKEEIIHHLNGIKTDNRKENLAICLNKTHYLFIKKLQNRILELENKLR